jgi:hypothetical protein
MLVKAARGKVWLAAAATVSAAVVVAWALWPRPAAIPQARRYLEVSACLLTGPGGVEPGTPGAVAWAAMEGASLATHVMVSYLPAGGPGGVPVPVMLNTLAGRQCGVIVIAAGVPAGEVIDAARRYPRERFVLIAPRSAAGAAPANTVIVSAAGAPGRIGAAIRAVAAAA